MTDEPLFKYINVLDANGRPMRDRRTGKLVSRRVRMSDDEVAALRSERGEIADQQEIPQ